MTTLMVIIFALIEIELLSSQLIFVHLPFFYIKFDSIYMEVLFRNKMIFFFRKIPKNF